MKKIVFLAALAATVPGAVYAQDKDLVPDEVKAGTATTGWDYTANVGANVNLSHNSHFIGQQDGLSATIGGIGAAGAMYKDEVHEWATLLSITEAYSYTPTLEEFVKSADRLALESIYLYSLAPWVGPFVRLQAETSILEGEFVGEKDRMVAGHESLMKARRVTLTGPFEPLLLKESAGAFLRPTDDKRAKITFRLGVGGRQTLVSGEAYAVTTVDDTTVTLSPIGELIQVGGELAAMLTGELEGGKVTYGIFAEALMPFATNKAGTDTRSSVDLTNIEVGAMLSFKLVSWASVDYQLRALRTPGLFPDGDPLENKFQVQNNLLLTFTYALIESRVKK